MKMILRIVLIGTLFGVSAHLIAKGSELVVGWEAAPRSVDPRFASDANSQYLEDLVHCSLVGFDEKGQLQPELAKKWTWETPTKLLVSIRKDVRFSDKTSVTTADVLATYSFFKSKSGAASPRAGAFRNVKKISLASGNRIQFELEEADSSFVTNLIVGILPAKVAARPRFTKVDFPSCGPFALKEHRLGQLVFHPNKQYSLSNPAKLEALRIKVIKDERTRFDKLRAGELDLVQNLLSREKLKKLNKSSRGLKVVRTQGLNVAYLGFNFRDKNLQNKAVRRAISLAIDRRAMIKFIMGGMAEPARTLLPPNSDYFDASLPEPKSNPELAKKILDEAGIRDPDGKGPKARLHLKLTTTTDRTRLAVAKAIASQLTKVGLKTTVQSMEWGRFKQDVEAGKVQMWTLSWIGFKDPDIFRYAFSSKNVPPSGPNRGFFRNDKLDGLLDRARGESDLAKRKKLYSEIQRLVSEELPYVFLWHEEVFAVVRDRVKGFRLYADGRLSSLVDVQLSKK